MASAKEEASSLEKFPDGAGYEDIQYYLYAIEKVKRGLERADSGGAIAHDAAKERLGKWLAP